MEKKSIFLLMSLIFMIVLSVGSVSAEDLSCGNAEIISEDIVSSVAATDGNGVDLETTDRGIVSGGVDIINSNPGNTSGEIIYNVPINADVKKAHLYVNIYSGSAQPTYAAQAEINMTSKNITKQLANEQLICTDGSTDGTVYVINNHTTKVYSNYQLYYDVLDEVKDLSGNDLKITVGTSKIDGKNFDGRIGLIALVVAYDDGDSDVINYWINSGQSWTNNKSSTIFNASTLTYGGKSLLTNIALSSTDAKYVFNDNILASENYTSGWMYKYHKWDVTDKVKVGFENILNYTAGVGSYGSSLRNVLSVLTIEKSANADISKFTPEYTSGGGACYAGTNNTLTVAVTVDKNGSYVLKLLADGVIVDSKEVNLSDISSTVLLTDSSIRSVDASTVNGANNSKVNYTVEIFDNDAVCVGSKEISLPVLYDGYLGKDYAYPSESMESFVDVTISGDVIIKPLNDSTYMASSATNRVDIWDLNLSKGSNFVNAYIYLAYNWDKSGVSGPIFNVSFNSVIVNPVKHYRDQSNLGSYGKYGYGVFIYDVSDLIKSGENTFVVNKLANLTAVYPSTLMAMYNTTGSSIRKHVIINNGADLLTSSSYNIAGRVVSSDSILIVDTIAGVSDVSWYVFAAGAQDKEGDLVFNNNSYVNVWNGTSNSYGCYVSNVTDIVGSVNNISFVSTGSTILALQQMLVQTYELISTELSVGNMSFYYQNGDKLIVYLKDTDGNTIAGKTVSILINGKNYELITDESGKCMLNVDFVVGNYPVAIEFLGDTIYQSSSLNSTLKIIKAPAKISVSKFVTQYKSGKQFKIKLTNEKTGKPLTGIKLSVKVFTGNKYKTYYVITNSNGVAYLKASTLSVGSHNVEINAVNSGVSANKVKTSIVITKAKTIVSAPKVTNKYHANKYFNVKVINKNTKKAIPSLVLKLKVATGKTCKVYSIKTNAKGIASFNTKNLKLGSHKVSISSLNKNYSVAKKSIITIKR